MSPTHSKDSGLSKQTWISIGVFAALLVVVLATRQDTVSVGMRELTLPKILDTDVVKIEIAGKHKALLTKQGSEWRVADPQKPDVSYPAETSAAERVTNELATLVSGGFVSGRAEKHDELEVTAEKGTIVRAETKSGTKLALVVGRFAKGGGNFVRRESDDEVFIMKGNLAGQVRKDVDAWRDKKIVDMAADQIALAVVTAPDGSTVTIVHEKTEAKDEAPAVDVWKLKEGTALPAGFRVDTEALARLARSAGALRATGFLDDAEALAKAAFNGGSVALTSVTGDKVTLTFGSPDADKKVAVKREGHAQVYLVTDYTAKQVVKPLVELRDLSLFPGASVDGVSEVRFASPAAKASVKNDGAAWSYDGPDAGIVDVAGIAAKLGGVLRLKGARVVGDEGTVKPKLTDELRIDVVKKDGTVLTARMGGEVPGDDGKPSSDVYATTGDGLVYAIGKFQKTRHEKPAELFKPVERPPQGMGGMGGGGMPGLESLPPEIRKQLEQQLKAQGM